MLPISKTRRIGLAALQAIALPRFFLRVLSCVWFCKKKSYTLNSAIPTKETVRF